MLQYCVRTFFDSIVYQLAVPLCLDAIAVLILDLQFQSTHPSMYCWCCLIVM